MKDYETSLAEFVKQLDYKKMSAKRIANEKRWFTDSWNRARKHERHQLMIKWFLTDRQAKFYVGAAAGAGMALAGTILEPMIEDMEELGLAVPATAQTDAEFLMSEAFGWLIPGMSTHGTRELFAAVGVGESFKSASDLATSIPDILKLSGAGFSGACLSILLLEAIFNGTNLGDMLQAAAEAMPF